MPRPAAPPCSRAPRAHLLQPLEERGHLPGGAADAGGQALGHHARDVLGEAAARHVHQAAHVGSANLRRMGGGRGWGWTMCCAERMTAMDKNRPRTSVHFCQQAMQCSQQQERSAPAWRPLTIFMQSRT